MRRSFSGARCAEALGCGPHLILAVLGAPQLRSDEELFARANARSQRCGNACTHLVLIVVAVCRVDMPVAAAKRTAHGLLDDARRCLPSAEADQRHVRAAVQRDAVWRRRGAASCVATVGQPRSHCCADRHAEHESHRGVRRRRASARLPSYTSFPAITCPSKSVVVGCGEASLPHPTITDLLMSVPRRACKYLVVS